MSTFEVHREAGIQRISCPSLVELKNTEELLKKIQPDLASGDRLVILDFAKTKDIVVGAYRVFTLLHQAAKKNSGFIVSLNLDPLLVKQLTAAGLDSIFNPRSKIEEAYKLAGIEAPKPTEHKPTIDVKFINPFVNATINTIEVQANTKIQAGKCHLKTEQDSGGVEIIAVISLTSKAFQGTIALCFPAQVFLGIYSGMVGETHTEITKETEDAAGEVLNIIFGQAKAELNEKGYEIQKAIPAVIRGNAIKVHHTARQVAVILPFETAHGSFYLEVGLD